MNCSDGLKAGKRETKYEILGLAKFWFEQVSRALGET